MSAGAKIIEGLEQAVRGDFAAVYIEGQTWRRVDWQPIETAPKDGTQIICWWSKSKVYEILDWCDGRWSNLDGDEISQPTHWMPLPAPPQGASQ